MISVCESVCVRWSAENTNPRQQEAQTAVHRGGEGGAEPTAGVFSF